MQFLEINPKKAKGQYLYWLQYWAPSVVVGLALSAFRISRPPNASPKKIVIFLIEHMGDVILSVPLLRAIRKAFPTSGVTVIVSGIGAPILEGCPYIDTLILASGKKRWFEQLVNALSLSSRLTKQEFDLAILPKDHSQDGFNELIAIATRSKWKISLRPPKPWKYRLKPMKFGLFHDEFVDTVETKHEVEYRLDSVRRFITSEVETRLQLWLNPNEVAKANDFLSGIAHGEKIAVAFGIGATRGKRLWPLQGFAAVIDSLSQSLSFIPLIIVGPEDIDRAAQLQQMTSVKVYCQASATVRESAALMSACALFIGNDSGPMHLAASAKIPVVEISCHPQGGVARHMNSPVRYGAFDVRSIILQPHPLSAICASGCQFERVPHCITQISPEMVVEAAKKILLA